MAGLFPLGCSSQFILHLLRASPSHQVQRSGPESSLSQRGLQSPFPASRSLFSEEGRTGFWRSFWRHRPPSLVPGTPLSALLMRLYRSFPAPTRMEGTFFCLMA